MDEHFAKALGKQTWKQIQGRTTESARDDSAVDDHFTKALGDTWLRIKARNDVSPPSDAYQRAAANTATVRL